MKVYVEFTTKEKVFEEDSISYVLDNLGIQINPKGKNGECTQEQYEMIEAIKEWYFSGNWIEEEWQEEQTEYNYESEMIDRLYEDNLNRRMEA